jgi:hypothetical protein
MLKLILLSFFFLRVLGRVLMVKTELINVSELMNITLKHYDTGYSILHT